MWQCEIRHDGLHKYRLVKGETQEIAELRAAMQMRSWNEQWERAQASRARRQFQLKVAYDKETNRKTAAEQTKEAQDALDVLNNLLTSALEDDHTIDWSQLKQGRHYPVARPTKPDQEPIPREPDINSPEFAPHLNLLGRVIPALRDKERARVTAIFSEARGKWLAAKEATEHRNREATERYSRALIAWESAGDAWLEECDKRNAAIDAWKAAYESRLPQSIPEYSKLVLGRSEYPDTFPADAAVDYVAETRTIVVDYALPDISMLPTLKEIKYLATRETFQEVHVSEAWLNRTYDLACIIREGVSGPRFVVEDGL